MLRLGQRLMRAGAAGIGFGFLIVSGFAWWATTAAHAGNGSTKDDITIVEAPLRAWHGCYIGATAGGNIDSSSATIGAAATSIVDLPKDGLALGGYTGCSLQTSSLIVGVEADINTASGDPHWFGSARVRLGFTPDNLMMFYVTGGYAWANQSYTLQAAGTGTRINRTAEGYAFGGGVEYAIGNGNMVRLEAIHYDYDGNHHSIPPGFAAVHQAHTVVRVGVTLAFAGGVFDGFTSGVDQDVVQ